MKNPFVIISEQWKQEIGLCWWWTPEEYSDYLNSIGMKDSSKPTACGESTVTDSGWLLMWVWERDAIDMLITLNHEIFHVADYMLRKKVWITLSDDSDESYAYTIAWIQEKMYEYIKLEPNVTIKE